MTPQLTIPDLAGKAVLITGASTGIGAELARAFAAQGALVGLHYNASFDAAKALADEINKRAQDDVATIPLGQFRIRSAWRRSITGLAQGSMPYPWGVRPAG